MFANFVSLTWNIEGFRRNLHSLKYFTVLHKPNFVFLSEPQLLQCDVAALLQTFHGCYSYHLNSEDLHNPEIALDNSKIKGGTMVLWQTSMDPYITIIPTNTSSITALLLKIPGYTVSVHLCIYMPTSGKEVQFVSAISCLDSCIDDILEKYPEAEVFVRGDANVNPKNTSRSSLFSHFLSKYSLNKVQLDHPTYHHFLGNGEFDSFLDVILHSSKLTKSEIVTEIICKNKNPLVQSHHDIILSRFNLPPTNASTSSDINLAPRIPNDRVKIVWSDEGIADYEAAVGDNLDRLRETWCNPSSPASMSILLSCTYSLLSSAAKQTNKSILLSDPIKPKPRHHPHIKSLQKDLLAKHKIVTKFSSSQPINTQALQSANQELLKLKNNYRQAIRKEQRDDAIKRDEKLNDIHSNPSAVFATIKKLNRSNSSKINSLNVGDKTYVGNDVPDGFFASLSALKSPDMSNIHSTPQYQSTLADFQHILKICRSGEPIPDISPKVSTEILLSLKSSVNDFFSITASHFTNAGRAGFAHFHFLLSALIKNVNLASLEELNTIWACILYKGHGKDKESDRSYRTISTCPLLAKALDTYAGQLNRDNWANVEAATQFQGAGSSHELAALLLTESVQHSLFTSKKPLFVLLLDAKSAFDKVVRECAIRNAYLAGTTGHSLLYLNSRLESRKTHVEYYKVIMEPIQDLVGVEQGGVNSDRIYKLCNNVQLSTAQQSGLGADLGSAVVSAIGQADDTVLQSHSLHQLHGLLHLTVEYCQKYHVELVPEKTKLLAFFPKHLKLDTYLQNLTNTLNLDGIEIDISSSAEHVGIIRSPDGNMPNIISRMSAHTKAIMAVLPTGMAHSHRGNPTASLHLDRVYGTPVLLSGLASLVLTGEEISAVHHYHKLNLQRLQRLCLATPECVVMLLAGSLPATGILHLRMLSLLGMIARLGPENILHNHGRFILLSAKEDQPCKSWFLELRVLCLQYSLPDPLIVLQSPLSKLRWKHLCKSKVVDWWEQKLRGEADLLPSLQHFKPAYMSLSSPHPLWSCAGSPYEVGKAVIAARMLSGRYKTDRLTRHWTKTNPDGLCRLPGCENKEGSLEHILLHCSALADSRSRIVSLIAAFLVSRPELFPVIRHFTIEEDNLLLQFLLDPTCLPLVISTNRTHPDTLKHCLYLGRTWCYSIHIYRSKIMKQLDIK